MSDVDRYIEASVRANTLRSYDAARRHFEVEWGGYLPATPDTIARYLAEYAERLSTNTLKQRLAALSQWHKEQGFVDPTRAPIVRKVLKGIQALHPKIEKRAEPLQIAQLSQVSNWLAHAIERAEADGDLAEAHRCRRDLALVLLGFWRGFRTDELMRLKIEHLQIVAEEGMTCFLPTSKGDRQNQGRTFKVPALSRLCPVKAVRQWISAANLAEGPLFRSVNQWGQIGEQPLHENSFVPVLRKMFTNSGLPSPDSYSGHSLRRGFAGWANKSGWDIKALMEYVGWKDVHSAMRYIDGADPSSRIVAAIARPEALPSPVSGNPM